MKKREIAAPRRIEPMKCPCDSKSLGRVEVSGFPGIEFESCRTVPSSPRVESRQSWMWRPWEVINPAAPPTSGTTTCK